MLEILFQTKANGCSQSRKAQFSYIQPTFVTLPKFKIKLLALSMIGGTKDSAHEHTPTKAKISWKKQPSFKFQPKVDKRFGKDIEGDTLLQLSSRNSTRISFTR